MSQSAVVQENAEKSSESFVAPPSQEMARRAQALLWLSPYLAVRRVNCALDQGSLVLEGRLPSYYFKQVAQETVAELEDVDRVINRIEVVA